MRRLGGWLVSLLAVVQVSQAINWIPEQGVDLPVLTPYQPEKIPQIPILLGERRCGNYYNGGVLPCLWKGAWPPYSYSTTEAYNGEYRKRRKRESRRWRTIGRD